MSNDNFQTPVSCVTSTEKGATHKDERETYRDASPGMTDSQSVRPGLDISTVPEPTHSDDTDAHSSGNDSAERESEGHMGRDASTCSSHNGKGSTTETTESKSSNGNSPSPPSSSVSYSLLSGSSEQDHLTSQTASGDQPARLQTQRELLNALRELKLRMPAGWRRKGRSSTLASLQYALSCVKQVRANQEYYHQWSVEESHGCCLDLSSFTIEELDNITSEYTLQNTDTFSVAVSFLSGKVVYISSQAASLLRCKPEKLQGALFSELLAPQDVSTFYSSTAPSRLPPWSSCAGTTSQVDCAEEKSMFCRISRGRDSDGEVKYYPFRLTPYQLTLRDSDTSQPEPCCLLIAEKVHSGYEAPRIPADKRIFTTSHTPNCLFQEIDERAVPLLGYLPQDLVGKPVLIYLHPEDRLLMVAIHKKILQFAGQPFDHSPLRMRARSGEYLTLDTSWSSFINPWSRKVAFIVGRHKVRTSPLNEDVFTAPEGEEVKTMSPDVPQLNELIHRFLVQPIHGGSSQGYGSLGSSGSHEHHQSAASSSESNGHASEDQIKPRKPMTFEQICQDMHMVKASGQQVFIESRNRPPALKQGSLEALAKAAETAEASTREGLAGLALSSPPRMELPTTYSYQQINCLDSIIRYLESFNVPGTVKRKCGSSSCTTSSTSDDDKQRDRDGGGATEDIAETHVVTEGSKVVPAAPGHPLTPLALHCKAESVVSATSQCSFSSTIVHVGDKKPPESDIVMMEEPPTTPTPSTSAPLTAVASPMPVNPQQTSSPTAAVPEKEKDKERRGGTSAGKGLTKAVLSTHTQQEEQAFLNRFRDVSQLRMVQPSGPPQLRSTSTPGTKVVNSSQNYPSVGNRNSRRHGRGGKRRKHQVDGNIPDIPSLSGSGPYRGSNPAAIRPNIPSVQHSSTSWPPPAVSQTSGAPMMTSFPPGYMPMFPISSPFLMPQMGTDPSLQAGVPRFPMQGFPPVMPPVMTFMMPNYMFPQLGNPGPQLNPANLQLSGQMPAQMNPLGQFPCSIVQMNPGDQSFNPAIGQFNPLGSQMNPTMPAVIPQQFYNPNPPFIFPNSPSMPAGNANTTTHGQSRSSTPQSTGQQAGEREGAGSPLFQSRCSSPLNLLQLEELPSNRTDATQQTPPPGGGATQGGGIVVQNSSNRSNTKDAKLNNSHEVNESNQDAMSTSSDMLDLLLQEDSRSGTGSAASGSGSSGSGSFASGSNGCSTSGSGTSGSGTRSSNTSKYFGSIDSSENDHTHKPASGDLEGEQFIKFVLQDPIWLLMANTDDKVMMTYQIPIKDRDSVLKEDRDALKAVQKHQPHFTEEQTKELTQVHPWIQTGCLPKAINITSCTGCESPPDSSILPPFDLDFHEMDLSMVLREEAKQDKLITAETAFPLSPPSSDNEQKDIQASLST